MTILSSATTPNEVRRRGIGRLLLASVGIALIVPTAAIRAQSVHGVIRDQGTGAPVPGAVVELMNRGTTPIVRTVSDGQGRYTLHGDGSAERLHVLRIGFRPADTDLPAGHGTDITMDVSLMHLATLLQPVRAVASRSCRGAWDSPAAEALLARARDGVLATEVAAEARPATMVRVLYKRQFNENDEVTAQAMWTTSDQANRSFAASRTAAEFVKQGFARDTADGLEFFAPDAGTVVDPAFGDGYCYRIISSHDRPHQLGLEFEPAKYHRDLVQITGTLWTDTLSRTLSDIDFRYLNLDRAMERASPGGRISFHQLSNGIVLIHRWSLRLPTFEEQPAEGFAGVTRHWYVPVETGGRVASAWWPDGYTWTAGLGNARLHILDASGHPVAAAMVRMPDAGYYLRSDSAGMVKIPFLVAGPWDVVARDSTIADLPLRHDTKLRLDVHWGMTTVDTLRMDSAPVIVAREFCRHGLHGTATSVLVGVLRDTDGVKPVAHARVMVAWRTDTTQDPFEVMAATSDSGVFAVCGLPVSTSFTLSAGRGDDSSRAAYFTTRAFRTVVRRDLRLSADAAAAGTHEVTPASRAPGLVGSASATAQGSAVRDGITEIMPVEQQAPDDEERTCDYADDCVRPGVAPEERAGHSQHAEAYEGLSAATPFESWTAPALAPNYDVIRGPGVEDEGQADQPRDDAGDDRDEFDAHE